MRARARGSGPRSQGGRTPLTRPMRSRAAAIAAPVLPALTIASATPSRTASRTAHDRRVLLLAHRAGGLVVHRDHVAGVETPMPVGRRARQELGVTSSSRPTSSTRDAELLDAAQRAGHDLAAARCRRPWRRRRPCRCVTTRRHSTSTACGPCTNRSSDTPRAAASQLSSSGTSSAPARRACGSRTDASASSLGGPALGDGHGVLPRPGSGLGGSGVGWCELELGEGRPSGVDRFVVGVDGHVGCARGLATRRERELEEHGVAHELLEVDLVPLDRIGLAVDRVRPRRARRR